MMQKATLNSEPSLSKLGHSDFQIRTKRSELGHYPRVKLKSQLSIRATSCAETIALDVRAGSTGAYKSEAPSLPGVFPELRFRAHCRRNRIGLEALCGRVSDSVPLQPNPSPHSAIPWLQTGYREVDFRAPHRAPVGDSAISQDDHPYRRSISGNGPHFFPRAMTAAQNSCGRSSVTTVSNITFAQYVLQLVD
jgi:hypothetical protein